MSLKLELGFSELRDHKLVISKSVLAELVGTFTLVFFGCGACIGSGDNVRIALAFGLTVASVAQIIGHVSGCHINPAITLGLFVANKIAGIKAICYIVAQCLGAVLGALILNLVVPETQIHGLGTTMLASNVGIVSAIVIETFITFVLVLVVFAVAADDNNSRRIKGSAPLAIGLTISAAHLFAIPYTGASMNPARSLGPALVANQMGHIWIYWVGPLLGGVLAAFFYQLVLKAAKDEEYRAVRTRDATSSV